MLSLTVYSKYQSQYKAWEAVLYSCNTGKILTRPLITTALLYFLVPKITKGE